MIDTETVLPEPPTGKPTARLFFAIWPDGAVRDQLDKVSLGLHHACGGRRTRAATIHLTLAFLGEVELGRIPPLLELASRVGGAAFELRLTRFDWWRKKRIAWAAPERVPAALSALVEDLTARLKEADFPVDERPYSPHVTLVRKADCRLAEFSSSPIEWPVEEFVLVRSVMGEDGSNYEMIGRWPLQRPV
jgi:2'-5' RNA ligase